MARKGICTPTQRGWLGMSHTLGYQGHDLPSILPTLYRGSWALGQRCPGFPYLSGEGQSWQSLILTCPTSGTLEVQHTLQQTQALRPCSAWVQMMPYFQPCRSETTVVPSTASTAGPLAGTCFGCLWPQGESGPSLDLGRKWRPFPAYLLYQKHQANQQHTSSVLLPCHPLALGLKANRIFAGRVRCSE